MAEETFVAYQKDNEKRKALNDLMESTFHFSFEPWYLSGHWTQDYKPYSIFEGNQIVANAGAYRMHLTLGRRTYTALQIGAVTSAEAYRGKHRVSSLFDTIFKENSDVDFFFLYAEETAKTFYPRFGFVQHKAFFTEKEIEQNHAFSFRKLDYENDQTILLRMARHGKSLARLRMANNMPLRIFCLPFNKDRFYYDEARSVLLIGEKKDTTYAIDEIWTINPVDAETVAGAWIDQEKAVVVFRFLPEISGGRLVEDPSLLFVRTHKHYDITNFILGPMIRT